MNLGLAFAGVFHNNATQAQVINFDAPGGLGAVNYSGQGAYSDAGQNFWNPIIQRGSTLSGTNSDGVTLSAITLADTSPQSYSPGQGAQGTPAGLEAPFLLENSGSVVTDVLNNIPDGTYNLYLYGKNDDVGDADRGTTFTAYTASTTARTLSTVNSVTATFTEGNDYIVFSNLVVGISGQITFTYTADASATGTFNPQSEGDFNGLQLVCLSNNVSLATVTNSNASNIQVTSATLNGSVLSTGGAVPNVTIYYGPTDGGINTATWSNSASLGFVAAGAFGQTVMNLSPANTYYFTAAAVNSAGTAWAAPSLSFNTPQLTVPVVTNLTASSVQASIATLNGQVLSVGGQTPTVILYYGSTDGGMNPAAWANSISLGFQSGAFAQTISGLTANSSYYFTAEATNAAGAGWATPSRMFTSITTNSLWPFMAVLTQHNDNYRSGDNLNESTLNTANVNTNSFGLLYIRPVDDQVYAQPLVMTNVSILGRGTHNLLIVATVNDSIYAFDADDPSVAQPYWKDSFISPPNIVAPDNADESAIGACSGSYEDFTGNFGIVGTPVIDPSRETLYVVVRTKEISGGTTSFVQRLHALNITTGAEEPNSPVVITATYPGTGDGSNVVNFDPLRENQRPALALVNGIIYITWASHCDNEPYHGWVIGYNETNLQQAVVWNDSPNGAENGIWMSGQGPCADTNGDVYLTVGNGSVDTTTNNDYGESFLKLTPTNGSMTVASYFIPYNWSALNAADADLGDAGMLLIPGTTLGISGGKECVLYLVNRDNMGGLSQGNADTNVVQTWDLNGGQIHGSPVWWSCTNGSFMYIWPASSDHLRQYQFTNGLFKTTPYAEGVTVGGSGSPGGILSVSADGTNVGTGIIWATINTTGNANQATVVGTLHAYNAQNVTNELWNSDMVPGRDSLGNLAKFVPPTIANGKVYVATFSDQVDVYGLLPPPQLTIVGSGHNTIISWPTNTVLAYTLQSSTNLSFGNWVTVTNNPITTNGTFQVTVPASVPAAFFRLTL